MEFFYKVKWLNGPLAGRELDLPAGETRLSGEDLEGEETIVWGVVTHIINDACTEEFDDCPVI